MKNLSNSCSKLHFKHLYKRLEVGESQTELESWKRGGGSGDEPFHIGTGGGFLIQWLRNRSLSPQSSPFPIKTAHPTPPPTAMPVATGAEEEEDQDDDELKRHIHPSFHPDSLPKRLSLHSDEQMEVFSFSPFLFTLLVMGKRGRRLQRRSLLYPCFTRKNIFTLWVYPKDNTGSGRFFLLLEHEKKAQPSSLRVFEEISIWPPFINVR